MKSVLLITNIPNPYRVPLFNKLNESLRQQGRHFKVLFAANGYARRKFELDYSEIQFNYDILSSRNIIIGNSEGVLFTYNGLLKSFNRFNPDVAIITGFSIGTLKLFLRSLVRMTNYIIWAGSIQNCYHPASFFRKTFRKILISRAKAFIAYGAKAKEYFMSLGVPESR